MTWIRGSFVSLLVGVVVLAGCAPKTEEAIETEEVTAEEMPPVEEPLTAVAELHSRADSQVTGTVTFIQRQDGVEVVAEISGAPPGTHGLHLHETGDCSAPDFTSAGGHFNPTGVEHGCPESPVHHAGDFGNVEIGEDGTGRLTLKSTLLTLAEGPNSAVGKAVIFHEHPDDCVSQPTGDAGGRLACGVVTLEGEAEGEGEGGGEAGYESAPTS